ncbi:hypothetical protein PR202_gb09293 [Eleusine coracana subsp. coracana]|uniref:Uncharacterized protein n=1 Tax=Eleusine coracana subsp. coracana TaxID=191504 RepID=A0AAV5EEI3_ELECO|nr:hypothetical protein PR202_gb09293 [Eleusine coracana subsp. coracana]
MEMVCLHDFQTFEDKSSAINIETGVNEKLAKMIMNWHCPGQTLAVEKAEYAGIIQTSLDIPCLCDDAVMELMWGLKNVMRSLVPKEKSGLRKEDRLPMSQGLIMFLRCYELVVKPEVVNEQIVLGASVLYG